MKIVAFTGAGISASAGIPTFDSTWKGKPIRNFLTREYANNHPEEYQELMQETLKWLDKEPTLAHKTLAKAGIPIVTQNVDMLHQKAGSPKVIELHGNIKEGIVLYGDQIRNWFKAVDVIGEATHLLVIGCSLYSQPAGSLPGMAEKNGAKVIFINKDADKEVKEWFEKNLK